MPTEDLILTLQALQGLANERYTKKAREVPDIIQKLLMETSGETRERVAQLAEVFTEMAEITYGLFEQHGQTFDRAIG